MPGGGYVTTFTDITHFKDIERELQEVNETLEQRVQQRTQELREAIMSRTRVAKRQTGARRAFSRLPATICCSP